MLTSFLDFPADLELRNLISKHSVSIDVMVPASPQSHVPSAFIHTSSAAQLGDIRPIITSKRRY